MSLEADQVDPNYPWSDNRPHELAVRDVAYDEHAATWPLEAELIPLNHRFAFYSGWDAALRQLGVRIYAPPVPKRGKVGTDRG